MMSVGEVFGMLRVKKVELVEAFSASQLEIEINNWLERNKDKIIMDIKVNIYETVSEEESEDEFVVIPLEEKHSALLLIGEEI